MLGDLNLLYKGLQSRVYDREGHALALSLVDFGTKFTTATTAYLSANPGKHLDIKTVKERCLVVLNEAVEQVQQRLPENLHVFKGLSALMPNTVLSKAKVKFSDLPLKHLLEGENGSKIEQEYREISFVAWKDEVFDGIIPDDAAVFWIQVREFKNSFGESAFGQLAEYALSCLCLPISNAIVERIFSTVTLMKTKGRNRMKALTLDSLLRIKFHCNSEENVALTLMRHRICWISLMHKCTKLTN